MSARSAAAGLALAGLALAACGRSETASAPAAKPAAAAAAGSATASSGAAGEAAGGAAAGAGGGANAAGSAAVGAGGGAVAAGSGSTAAGSAAAAPAVIPADAKELLTAVVDDWRSTRATLRRFRRTGAGWEPIGAPWPGVVGKGGTAWGAGLHGAGAPAGRTGPVKREGDGKSPAGAFSLRGSYGYDEAAPAGTKLAYTPVDERWKCVDDPASKHYDRILDRTAVAPDWKSAEEMRRKDELYRWVVDVAHNPAHAPGGGSCIFLHVWRGAASSTVGCTAMDERKLAALVASLDPSAVFVLLPRAEYDALATAWALPN